MGTQEALGAKEVERLSEVTELRDENSQTFLLSDGTYEAVIYSEDKFYRTDENELIAIDNTIIETKYSYGSHIYDYVNASNATSIYFSKSEPSVLIDSGEHQLAYSLITDKETTAIPGEKGNQYDFPDFMLQSDNCLTYPGIFDGADLIYSVHNGVLKEYLVLSDHKAPCEFLFKFDTKDLTIKENEEGRLGVYGSPEGLIFEFASLFAVDSAEHYTDKLEYHIKEVTEEHTVIGIVIDQGYLNDPETVYPVLIDPSVMITGDYNTYDSFVSSKYPNANYYLQNWIRTGRDIDYNIRRTYIKFDLPSGIPAVNIQTAFIDVKYYSGATPNIKAYRATGSWSSSSVTWNNRPSYTSTNASGSATLYGTNNWYRLYVTDIVKGWYSGTYSNYGFVLKDVTESGTSQWTTYYSSDAPSPNKPELHINYSASTNYSVNHVSVKVYKDASYLSMYSSSPSYINTTMTRVGYPFSRKWNIALSPGFYNIYGMPWQSCSRPYSLACTNAACGSTCVNENRTPNHHKNFDYNCLYAKSHNAYSDWNIAIVITSANLCHQCPDPTHSSHDLCGLGMVPFAGDKFAMAKLTRARGDVRNVRVIQHELSHCFECLDNECTPNERCIMSGGFDSNTAYNLPTIWCTNCAARFNRTKH